MNSVFRNALTLSFWVSVFLVFFAYAASLPALGAEVFHVMPSTPDISVTDNATKSVNLGRGVRWIYLKNDCAQDMYFDLRGRSQAGGYGDGSYPLRLAQDQEFSANISTTTLGVSPGILSSSCTFTVIPAR